MEVIASNGEKVRTGDGVLVRDLETERWAYSVFSHCNGKAGQKPCAYFCVNGGIFQHIIPYAGNEDLVGTDDPMPHNKGHFRFGDKVEVRDNTEDDWEEAVFIRTEKDKRPHIYRVALKASPFLMEVNYKLCRKVNW